MKREIDAIMREQELKKRGGEDGEGKKKENSV